MSGDFLPLPRVLVSVLINQSLREQTLEICRSVIVAPREVAILASGRLHSQIIHNKLFACIYTDFIYPTHTERSAVDNDFLFLRGRCKRYVLTASTFDSKHLFGKALTAAHSDVLCEVSTFVHECRGHSQTDARFEAVDVIDNIIKALPNLVCVRSAHYDTFFDTPRLVKMTVADHLIFQAVVLCINSARQIKHSFGELYGRAVLVSAVIFATSHYAFFVFQVAAVLPQQTETGIVNNLHLFGVADCLKVLQYSRFPRRPRRYPRGKPKRTCLMLLICVGVVSHPL